jgi:hypothetical protein
MAGTKRKHGEGSSDPLYSNKSRSRPSIVESRVDPTYGQRSAIPGLDTAGDEDELDYGEDGSDALSYLRSVRLVIKSLRAADCAVTSSHERNADLGCIVGKKPLVFRIYWLPLKSKPGKTPKLPMRV